MSGDASVCCSSTWTVSSGSTTRHGHAAGDAVLCEAAARMRAVVRPYDAVGRYGGDEFVVIVAGAGAEQGAPRAAAAIAGSLRGRPIATPAGAVRVTASIGLAVAPAGSRDPERLIADADRAMYAAKRAGGDCQEGWFSLMTERKELT